MINTKLILQKTLGELLEHEDQVVRRQAIGIYKKLINVQECQNPKK